jgi:3-oxoacyl-[acyl-carrier-protein] synthase II
MIAITASAVRSCWGDGAETFAAALAGRSGAVPLRFHDPARVGVGMGYHVGDEAAEAPRRPSSWLRDCLTEVLPALRSTGAGSVPVLVGTGLGELRSIERWASGAAPPPAPADLHFGAAVAAVSPVFGPALTISNACSASGHCLALGQDLIEQGAAEEVVVAGADAMSDAMLAMIGRVAPGHTDRVRPFDAERTGVLLGEGAGAVVLSAHPGPRRVLARLLGTGLSCDAAHETAPDPAGIAAAMTDGLRRAGRAARDVDVVFTHGTGTGLNDPAEVAAMRTVLHDNGADPWLTGVKGVVGHTSGASALTTLDIALRSLSAGLVPPVGGLRSPLPEGADLRFVRGSAVVWAARTVQVNSFGFGGVNAVTILEAAG